MFGAPLLRSSFASLPHVLGSSRVDVASRVCQVHTPEDLVVDWIRRKIYWADSGFVQLRRLNLDGTGMEVVMSLGVTLALCLDLESSPNKLYWAQQVPTRTIKRMTIPTGGDIETVAELGQTRTSGIALDLRRRFMYLADQGSRFIRRAVLDDPRANNFGNGIAVIVDRSDGVEAPFDIAYDPDLDRLYWTDSGRGQVSYVPMEPALARAAGTF